MKTVAKYNICKGVSTLLTMGTPIVTLACCGSFFRERSSTAISAAGLMVILISLLFAKDKIAENFKAPSAFAIAGIVLVLIYLVENIMYPVKLVCWATVFASGIDEITFKRMYKGYELSLPKSATAYKHFGFIFANTDKLGDINERQEEN